MKVSIITPFYHGRDYMKGYQQMLEAVERYTAAHPAADGTRDTVEVIIVNDSPEVPVPLSGINLGKPYWRVITNVKNVGIHASRIAVNDPQDYEARSNIMWTATWALNTLISKGKSTDWMVHMLGQAVGAYTDATHGMTLAAVSLPYYRCIMPYGLKKFARFAKEVWCIPADGKTDEQLAAQGLDAMESWMKEIGLVMNISELGATEDMIEGIADATLILEGGYKLLDRSEIVKILTESMK